MPFNSDQRSSESGSAFDSMEAKDSRRTDFCLAHGKISHWEPCHYKRKSCKKLQLPAHAEFLSHQEWGLSHKKARYRPLTAGSFLSLCKIGASDSSCVSPRKLSLTFQIQSPSWSVWWGNEESSTFPLAWCSMWCETQTVMFFLLKPILLLCTRSKTTGVTVCHAKTLLLSLMSTDTLCGPYSFWPRGVNANTRALMVCLAIITGSSFITQVLKIWKSW